MYIFKIMRMFSDLLMYLCYENENIKYLMLDY
jgi:hypothetical protein